MWEWLKPPNLLSLSRIVLTPFVVRAVLASDYSQSLLLVAVASITDALDGWLARSCRWATQLGGILDPIADKFMLGAIYISLGMAGAIPWWLVGLVFGRDVLILGFALVALLFTTLRQFPPSIWGKISTSFQMSTVLAAMLAGAFPAMSLLPPLVDLLIVLTAIATLWSGVHYAWRGSRRLFSSISARTD